MVSLESRASENVPFDVYALFVVEYWSFDFGQGSVLSYVTYGGIVEYWFPTSCSCPIHQMPRVDLQRKHPDENYLMVESQIKE